MKKITKSVAACAIASSMVLGSSACVMAEANVDPFKVVLNAEISEKGAAYLTELAGMDCSWLKSAGLDLNLELGDLVTAVDFILSMNDSAILTGSSYYDSASMKDYVVMHEISEEYLLVNLASLMEELGSEELGGLSDSFQSGFSVGYTAVLQDPEKQAELTEKYALPFLGLVGEPEMVERTIEFEDSTETVSGAEYKVNLEDFANTALEVLSTLKSDEELLAILSSNGNELSAETIDEIISELENSKENDSLATKDVYLFFGSNEDGTVLSGDVILEEGDSDIYLVDMVAVEDEDGLSGYLILGDEEDLEIDFLIGEEYEFVLSAEGQSLLYMNFGGDETSGSLWIEPVADTEDAPLADLAGYALELGYDFSEEPIIGMAINEGDEPLVTITLAGGAGHAVEVPDLSGITGFNVEDEEALNNYLASGNIFSLVSKLIEAGLPQSLLME